MRSSSRSDRLGSRLTTATAAATAAIAFAPLARGQDPAACGTFRHHGFDAIPSFITPQGSQEGRADSQLIPPARVETRRQIAGRVGTEIGNEHLDTSIGTDSGHNRNPEAANGRIRGTSSGHRFSDGGDRSAHPILSRLSDAPGPGNPGVETVIAEVLDEIGHLAMYVKSLEDKRVKAAVRDAIQRILNGDKHSHFTKTDHDVEVMNNLRDILDFLEMGTHYSYDRKNRQATLKPAGEDSVQSLFSAAPNIERVLTARHIYEYLLTHLERGVHYEIVKIKNVKGARIALTEKGKSEVRALTGGLDVKNIEKALQYYEALRAKGLPLKQASAEVAKEFAVKVAFANPFQEVVNVPIDLTATIRALIEEHAIDYVPDYDTETVALTERGIGQACHYLKVGALEELGENAQAQIEQAIAEVKLKKQDETGLHQPEDEIDTEAQEALRTKAEAAEKLANLVRRAVKEALRGNNIARRAARRKGSKAAFPIDDEYSAVEEQEKQPTGDYQEDIEADIDYERVYPPEEDEREADLEARYADEIADKGNGKGNGAEQLAARRAAYPEAFDPFDRKNVEYILGRAKRGRPTRANARKRKVVIFENSDDIPTSANRREVRAALRHLS